MPGRFDGFPKGAAEFLAELARNNTKAWFDDHRALYEEAIVAPALLFISELGARLKKVSPGLAPEPRIGGSLFRIHRDTRFSKDKAPYKVHVGMRFRHAGFQTQSKCDGAIYYVEFDARALRLGAGAKEFDPESLTAYRAALQRRGAREKLEAAVARAEAEGYELIGEQSKKAPVGLEDHPHARRKGLFLMREAKLPAAFHKASLVEYCAERLGARADLFKWLMGNAFGA